MPASYLSLFEYLRQLVDPARQAKIRYPQFALVEAYWHLGRLIVEDEQGGSERAGYGEHLIERLSEELTRELGKGYKLSNLKWFRQFYLAFPVTVSPEEAADEESLLRRHLREELTWSHYRLLLAVKDGRERFFYMQRAADEAWSVRTLQRLLKLNFYEQLSAGERVTAGAAQRRFPAALVAASQRRTVGRLRQQLLGLPGWALVNPAASELRFEAVPAPALLFFHYHLHCLIAVWTDLRPAQDPGLTERFRRWQHEQAAHLPWPVVVVGAEPGALAVVSGPDADWLPTLQAQLSRVHLPH